MSEFVCREILWVEVPSVDGLEIVNTLIIRGSLGKPHPIHEVGYILISSRSLYKSGALDKRRISVGTVLG